MTITPENEALNDWRTQFDAIFNHIPVGIAYLSPDMRYVRVNPYLAKKLERTPEELLGLHCYDVVGMYRDDPVRVGPERVCDDCGVKKAMETGKPVKRVRRVRPDLVAENLGVPVLDRDGSVIGAAEIILDVTERAEMEERLRVYASGLEAQVEEKAHEKEEFIAVLAHDLKSPLTSIIGYSSLMLDGFAGGLDGDLKACAEGVQANAQRMLGLVRNFLSAGRMDNISSLERMPIHLESVILECLRNMGPQIKDRGLSIETSFRKDVPKVVVDKEQMERVITNLIANAIRFTPHGGRITLGVALSEGCVSLEVSDTGIGIPEGEQPMLFDKYYQGKSAARYSGTGLGLYIAKKIVEAHNGRILVSSLEGKGTTFTVQIPCSS